MRVLIIGGTGLISTAITAHLLERGVAVTHLNRGKTHARLNIERVEHIQGDRSQFTAFEQQMAEAGPFDCVIDMVCYEPEEAESAVRAFEDRVGQYIFCSTVDVYSKPPTHYPIRENTDRSHPLGSYAQKKTRCETILMQAFQEKRLPVTIIRPAHTYGDPGAIIHTFGGRTTYLDRIRKGKAIIVHGDGSSLWTSCHAEDVGRAFANAVGNAQTIGRAYHVPGEEWLTWNNYHQQVAQAMEAPEPTLIHIPTDLLAAIAPKRANISKINFQFNNIFDNSAARSDLGFRYTIPWLEGVRRTVAWLDAHKAIENSDDDPFDDQIIGMWQKTTESLQQELQAHDS